MNPSVYFVRAALVGLSAACAAPFAQARNETFMQPVAVAMHKSYAREIVGPLPMLFGAATAPAEGAPELIGTPITVQGDGSATGDDPRKHESLSDETVCNRAFAAALRKLVDAARDAHAGAVVGIVSDYKGAPIDDGNTFECHAGVAWSHVFLRAQLVKSLEGASR